jgi:hypothetical protein
VDRDDARVIELRRDLGLFEEAPDAARLEGRSPPRATGTIGPRSSFIATCRRKSASQARTTMPMPPRPSTSFER